MRNTAIELEPELTANRSVPSGLTIRFWSESNGPRAKVLSKTPIPPAGVLPRKVGFPLPSFLKVRMELPAVESRPSLAVRQPAESASLTEMEEHTSELQSPCNLV